MGTLRLDLGSRADDAAAALDPDNDGFVETRVEGGTLVVTCHAGSAMAALRSLDDVLNCLRAAGFE